MKKLLLGLLALMVVIPVMGSQEAEDSEWTLGDSEVTDDWNESYNETQNEAEESEDTDEKELAAAFQQASQQSASTTTTSSSSSQPISNTATTSNSQQEQKDRKATAQQSQTSTTGTTSSVAQQREQKELKAGKSLWQQMEEAEAKQRKDQQEADDLMTLIHLSEDARIAAAEETLNPQEQAALRAQQLHDAAQFRNRVIQIREKAEKALKAGAVDERTTILFKLVDYLFTAPITIEENELHRYSDISDIYLAIHDTSNNPAHRLRAYEGQLKLADEGYIILMGTGIMKSNNEDEISKWKITRLENIIMLSGISEETLDRYRFALAKECLKLSQFSATHRRMAKKYFSQLMYNADSNSSLVAAYEFARLVINDTTSTLDEMAIADNQLQRILKDLSDLTKANPKDERLTPTHILRSMKELEAKQLLLQYKQTRKPEYIKALKKIDPSITKEALQEAYQIDRKLLRTLYQEPSLTHTMSAEELTAYNGTTAAMIYAAMLINDKTNAILFTPYTYELLLKTCNPYATNDYGDSVESILNSSEEREQFIKHMQQDGLDRFTFDHDVYFPNSDVVLHPKSENGIRLDTLRSMWTKQEMRCSGLKDLCERSAAVARIIEGYAGL